MSMLKRSGRWLLGNLGILTGVVVTGVFVSPLVPPAEAYALIPQCEAVGCVGSTCTRCSDATLGMVCGLMGDTGHCVTVGPPKGCICQP